MLQGLGKKCDLMIMKSQKRSLIEQIEVLSLCVSLFFNFCCKGFEQGF